MILRPSIAWNCHAGIYMTLRTLNRRLAWLCLVAGWGAVGRAAANDVSSEELVRRASVAAERGDNLEAIKLATLAIDQDPKAALAFYVRGRERFRAGQFRDAVADFDRYIALRPDVAPRQWERGIACYYAGMFAEGAQQFESYQEFDGQDVENSVWRYLCLVPNWGLARAQATVLPIESDHRVPMMQVYELYRGQKKPDDVLAAARAGNPEDEVLAGRMFYAHLYLGLWYDARGDRQSARRYLELAADEKLKDNRRINRFMWDVARVHYGKLRRELPAK
jgi:lipoprotein NlpI